MELKTIFGMGAILLLASASVKTNDHDDFKRIFGDEFITVFKYYHAELLTKVMKYYENLYKLVLRNLELTPKQEKSFKQHLATTRKLQQEIGDTVTIELIKKLKSFIPEVISELTTETHLYTMLTLSRLRIFLEYSTAIMDDVKEFQHKVYKRYHEIYVTIPDEELYANPEYTLIDQILQRSDVLNLSEYSSIFKLLGDFFDVPEYKELAKV